MRRLSHRLLLLVLVLALVAGGRVLPMTPAGAAEETCTHEQQQAAAPGHATHDRIPAKPRQDKGIGCVCCNFGVCMVAPGLPTPAAMTASIATSPIRYCRSDSRLAGRSLRPDPGPPRPIA